MDELKETKNTPDPEEFEPDGEYTGMSKAKATFLKILPMLIAKANRK